MSDHFLEQYRVLLDAEEAAFDSFEHAFEDGDREAFDTHRTTWLAACAARHLFLRHHHLIDC